MKLKDICLLSWNQGFLAGSERILAARLFWAIAVSIAVNSFVAMGAELPAGFVYLSEVAPTIRQDIRYAGGHNFTGRPVDGYQANECILTEGAADALRQVQMELAGKNLSLIVWDCYRPIRAVRDLVNWSRSQQRSLMKAEFFPKTNKSEFFARGYLSSHSAHSRGSTVDLGLVPSAVRAPPTFDAAIPLVPCTAPKGVRFNDGTIDFGTGYDCLDPLASTNNTDLSKEAQLNRILLKRIMQQHGFRSYSREWWHFTLSDDPFPGQSFDFPIVARNRRGQSRQRLKSFRQSAIRNSRPRRPQPAQRRSASAGRASTGYWRRRKDCLVGRWPGTPVQLHGRPFSPYGLRQNDRARGPSRPRPRIAAPGLRLRAGHQGAWCQGDSGVGGIPLDHEDGGVHGFGAERAQGFLKRLNLGTIVSQRGTGSAEDVNDRCMAV